MDLDKYIKKSEQAGKSRALQNFRSQQQQRVAQERQRDEYVSPIERRCLQCNRTLENKGEPLYYQKFCSQDCKDRYLTACRER